MDNQLKEVLGSWIQAVGTVASAVGSTPSTVLSNHLKNNLDLWGNVLQGSGNALLADAQSTINLEKIGNQIQAIGNTTVVAGMLLNLNSEAKQVLIIDGNWLQALGSGMAITEGGSIEKSLGNISNLLQMIGNSLQAIGGIKKLKEENESNHEYDSEVLEVLGSWIQAAGAVLQAIIQTSPGNLNKRDDNAVNIET